MRIAIDCRSLVGRHGIARYLRTILKHLLQFDGKTHFTLLFPQGTANEYTPSDRVNIAYLKGNSFVYKYCSVPQYLRTWKMDVYWSPTQDMPLFQVHGCRYVVTVHDIAFEHFPSWFPPKIRLMARLGLYRKSVAMADRILTDSAYTKQDVINTYGIPGEKTVVTHIGIDQRFRPVDKAKAQEYVRQTFQIDRPYVFYVNTVRMRTLFEAVAHLRHHEWRHKSMALVCLARSRDLTTDVPAVLAQEYGISDVVIHIDQHISDEALNHLYSGSEFFVSPSFYEGFGLTPLEALQSGASVCVSRTTSLPEVLENAAVYFDPYDPRDMAAAMRRLDESDDEKRRIIQAGKRLLERYNPENITRRIHEALTVWPGTSGPVPLHQSAIGHPNPSGARLTRQGSCC